jgi:hypothetical protein
MEASNNPHPSSSPQVKGLASSLIQAMHALRTSLLLTLALTACDGSFGDKETTPNTPKTTQKKASPSEDPPPLKAIILLSVIDKHGI